MMHSSRSPSSKERWLPPIAFFLSLAISLSIASLSMRATLTHDREHYTKVAESALNSIHDCFSTIISRGFTISTVITLTGGRTEDFDLLAQLCYEDVEAKCGISLRNFAIAPDGIVCSVYPLESNEALIGFNLLDLSKPGNQDALYAYQTRDLVVTNPFNLVQGGMGMGARLPIFLQEGDTNTFWGFSTLTLDSDTFLAHLESIALENMGARYRLYYEDADRGEVTLIAAKDLPQDPVIVNLHLENLRWKLEVSPENGWISFGDRLLAGLCSIIISLLCAWVVHDALRLRYANETLSRLAYLDSLTLCHSRQYVNNVLIDPDSGLFKSPNLRYSMAMIDVDHFKQINDSKGHPFGDRTLVAIAHALCNIINPHNGDCIVRLGGDEFIVLVNDVSRERFAAMLDTMVHAARALILAPDVHVSISIGGAHYDDCHSRKYYDMVQIADRSLYLAKEGGRDCYVIGTGEHTPMP